MPEPTPLTRTISLAVHEFRTPVTVATGYLRMLSSEQAGPLTPKQRKIVEEADRACRRIGALVEELSDLGKMMSQQVALSRQAIDLNALLSEVASNMHEGADRGVRLEVQPADQPATIIGDRVRMAAAFRSLMHSALRERGEAGTVRAQCSIVQDSDTRWAVVAIGDASLIEPLTQGVHAPPPFEEWRGGMGFALPLARRIIEAHGGTVWSAAGPKPSVASGVRLPLEGM